MSETPIQPDFAVAALKAFVSHSSSVLVGVDWEGNINQWNPGATAYFGHEAADMLGQPYTRLVATDQHGQFRKTLDKAKRGRNPPDIQLTQIDRDGFSHQAIFGLYPLETENGGLLAVSTDITLRKLAEEKLKESVGQVQAIVQTVLDGIITIDEEGIINAFNPAAESIFQYRAHEVIGCNINILMPEPFHSEHDQYLENYCQSGEAKVIGIGREVIGKRKDGSEFPMDLSVNVMQSGGNRAFVGVVKDISERKAHEDALQQQMDRTEAANKQLAAALEQLRDAQKQLIQSEKMAALGQLVAGVAHEINTPIGVGITAASQLENLSQRLHRDLEQGALKRSSLTQFVDSAIESASIITRNLERAAELVKSFKQVAVDETSDEKRRFEVGQYLGEILSSLSPSIRKARVDARLEMAQDIAIESYPGALAQVISNLVMNALTHAFQEQEERQLSLSLLHDDKQVRIQCRDNGKGIDPENIGRLFDPFFTTNRSAGNTGLGLHISYNIVTQVMHGDITVQSTPGEGTVFEITIPRGFDAGVTG